VEGRGSFGEAYPLFGFAMEDYDALFAEKLDLLLKLRETAQISWRGQFRPPLQGQGVFPRPHQAKLPVWLGVGGTPQSFVRAGPGSGSMLWVSLVTRTPPRGTPSFPAGLICRLRSAANAAGRLPRITFQMSSAMLEPDAMQRSITLLGTDVAPRVRKMLGHAVQLG
jgi:alkanesulfonate monooxygenase SsuD/methylene tetrahydromethanopterin reductase-like flavin-dependent oxidoreductase (luciferase family)